MEATPHLQQLVHRAAVTAGPCPRRDVTPHPQPTALTCHAQSDSPVWQQLFTFDVEDPDRATLVFSVKSRRAMGVANGAPRP